jgi:hypothetical protein
MKRRILGTLTVALSAALALGAACSNGSEVDSADGASGAGTDASGGAEGSGATSGSGASMAMGATSGIGAAAGAGSGGTQSQGCGDLSEYGEPCESTADCCTGLCDEALGVCASTLSGGSEACGDEGDACSNGTQCCTYNCQDGECSADACVGDTQACDVDGECCSGICTADGTCADLNNLEGVPLPPEAKTGSTDSTCLTSGNGCADSGDCCSGLCDGDVCSRGASYCVQDYDICTEDAECCEGICVKQDGALAGVCIGRQGEGTRCDNKLIAGEVCGGDCSLCCSQSCGPFGTAGTFICQPPSGCRPEGELCSSDLDCCGGDPDFTAAGNQGGFCELQEDGIGRCSKTGCTPHGAICGYDELSETSCSQNISSPQGTSCCQPTGAKMDLCGVDDLLIPRCDALGDTCVEAGAACGTSADCCNDLPCVQDEEGHFICYDPPGDGTCVPVSGPCTNDGDCCTGVSCVRPPGDATGFCGSSEPPDGSGGSPGTGGGPSSCALYGQSCGDSGDCCNDVPCDGGTCRFAGG